MSNINDNTSRDPFSDPSIKEVSGDSVLRELEGFNPFSNKETNFSNKPQGRGASGPLQYQNVNVNNTPAVLPSTQEQLSGKQQSSLSTAELQRKQEELERKAQELEKREQELQNATYNVRKNNWPPLPAKFCIGPCFYQDISVDIPQAFQKIVRTFAVLLANFILTMILLFALGSSFATSFGLAIVYMVVFTPFSYLCWFRPAYKAFRSDSSINFYMFFFVFFFQTIVSVVHSIGISGVDTCGFVVAIKVFNIGGILSYVLGALTMIVALSFAFGAIMDFIILLKIHALYRSTGASFQKAQAEFTQGVLRSEHVQNAATSAAASVLRSQFNNENNSNVKKY